MKSEDFLLLATAGFIIYLLNEKQKERIKIFQLQNQNLQLKNKLQFQTNYINVLNNELKQTIDAKNNIPNDIKNKLKKLIADFDNIDYNISKELISTSALIEINEKEKALFSLSKIIEFLLKKIFNSNNNFYNLIIKARDEKLLEEEEYYFVNGLRAIRNKEGHELNVNVEENLTASSFLIGIQIITKLKNIVNKYNEEN